MSRRWGLAVALATSIALTGCGNPGSPGSAGDAGSGKGTAGEE